MFYNFLQNKKLDKDYVVRLWINGCDIFMLRIFQFSNCMFFRVFEYYLECYLFFNFYIFFLQGNKYVIKFIDKDVLKGGIVFVWRNIDFVKE